MKAETELCPVVYYVFTHCAEDISDGAQPEIRMIHPPLIDSCARQTADSDLFKQRFAPGMEFEEWETYGED